ncbi:MAG: hypothetical protein ABIP71_03720 [Verrucomicrobiota bacterium]
MKKIVALALGLSLLGTVVSQAQEKKEHKRPALTEEQKKIVEKYDTNKDGKLDKEERAKISAEDKDKMPKRGAGKKKEGTSATAPEKKTESK